MKFKSFTAALAMGLMLIGASATAEVTSLRGDTATDENNIAEHPRKNVEIDGGFGLNFTHQPPLIPHRIRGYKIDLKSNKCLQCHSWKTYRKYGATKISITHFENRDDKVLADVSPRRYFCLQCHVPQSDAAPIIENTFKAADEQ